MENSPPEGAGELIAVATQLVLYSVFSKMGELDERLKEAIGEGFTEAALGAKLLAIKGPGEDRKAAGAALLEIIEHMREQTFAD
jgi:hypothetical protein